VKEQLEKLRQDALAEIKAAKDASGLQAIRVKYLGRKGDLTTLLRSTGSLKPEERPAFGKRANEIKAELEAALDFKAADLTAQQAEQSEAIDVTLPGFRPQRGTIHPITRMLDEMIEFFAGLGYEVAVGPEVELDKYNFAQLNFPEDHPARDMQDTFFVSKDVLLRTHTSPVQIRTMEARKPPLRVISPGKVYRHDRDLSHSPMFFQLEGFIVDKHISLADLKGTLTAFAKHIFSPDTPVRFRPSFFPFTEPSAEVDIGCIFCHGEGCRMCKQTGWIEILGSGMIHPQVLRNVGIDPNEWIGFAFGMGVERISILKYGIEPIATFFENDLRFLKQF
jgi:phenylalanyl-tRNA synthetase alpha chain